MQTYHVNFLYRAKGNDCHINWDVQRWTCYEESYHNKWTDKVYGRLTDQQTGRQQKDRQTDWLTDRPNTICKSEKPTFMIGPYSLVIFIRKWIKYFGCVLVTSLKGTHTHKLAFYKENETRWKRSRCIYVNFITTFHLFSHPGLIIIIIIY